VGRSVRDTQEFFGPRAHGWEDRFPDDAPTYARAVAELGPPRNGLALDVGCGTARATPFLAAAVGPAGLVVALDATAEMLAEAVRLRRTPAAALVQADASALPLTDGCADAILAAGLIPHLDDPFAGLVELARVAREGAHLGVFHPISRVALAARHGGVPSDDDAIAPARLIPMLEATGWSPLLVDDGDDRFLVVAQRVS
jgi:SAM-dependent methyltransferase